MTLTELNPRPIWAESWRRESYWRKVQCARTCPGHILPFDRIEEAIKLQYVYTVDVKQWNIALEQELQAYQDLLNPTPTEKKKLYYAKNKIRKPTKVFGKWS
jgi:hypothetical protein